MYGSRDSRHPCEAATTKRVVVDPDDAKGEEADAVAGVRGPRVNHCGAEIPVCDRHPGLEHELRRGDGEHAVAGRFIQEGDLARLLIADTDDCASLGKSAKQVGGILGRERNRIGGGNPRALHRASCVSHHLGSLEIG